MNKGLLIAVSGFSGSGKGTIMKRLLEKYPDYALSISATTRQPREGEREGVDYFFKTEEEFRKMIEGGELIEYAGYVGHHYGTPRAYVEEKRAAGYDVFLEIEVQGALKVKELFPETLLIFVSAPSIAEIRNRLKKRGTESDEVIEERIAQIHREIASVPGYDYLIINEEVEESVDLIHSILSAEHHKTSYQKAFLEALETEENGRQK